MIYVQYHIKSGEIVARINTQRPYAASEMEGYAFLEIEPNINEQDFYVKRKKLVRKVDPKLEIKDCKAVVGEKLKVTGLPKDAWVSNSMTGEITKVSRAALTVSRGNTGKFFLTVCGKYKPTTITVKVYESEVLRQEVVDAVNQKAEALKATKITMGQAQMMTYMKKFQSAVNYLAGNPSALDTQRIESEAQLRSMDGEALANLIIQKANETEEFDQKVDLCRIEALTKLNNAKTGKELQDVLEQAFPGFDN